MGALCACELWTKYDKPPSLYSYDNRSTLQWSIFMLVMLLTELSSPRETKTNLTFKSKMEGDINGYSSAIFTVCILLCSIWNWIHCHTFYSFYLRWWHSQWSFCNGQPALINFRHILPIFRLNVHTTVDQKSCASFYILFLFFSVDL